MTGMTVNGSALAASLEAGYPFHFAGNWTIEPQGQLIYQYTELGSGATISTATPASATPTTCAGGSGRSCPMSS